MQSKGVAWYDVKGEGWLRDIWVLTHPFYTLWHLSYVVLGAALAPVMNWPLLGWTVLAFFLGLGIAGHCLDELNGRPLRTQLSNWFLGVAAVLSVAGAMVIGVVIGVQASIWVVPCIVFGAFIVFAYNMEWPSEWMKQDFLFGSLPTGFFHRDIWFGVAWGAFPVITAYVAQTGTLSLEAVLVAVFALLYSMAQRKLSLQARFFRRKVSWVEGQYYLWGKTPVVPGDLGSSEHIPITKDTIIGPVDLGLKYMNGAVVAVALGLLIMHLMRGGL